MAEVERELRQLSKSLLTRIRIDLSCIEANDDVFAVNQGEHGSDSVSQSREWLAYPKTLRLTTRPRPPLNPDGTRSRAFNRLSRSCDMPSLILNLNESVEHLSEILVRDTLVPLFYRLHPERSGWDLSLLNLCAASISLTAASARDGAGRDISKMFKMQDLVLKDWKAAYIDAAPVSCYSADLNECALEDLENKPYGASEETLGGIVGEGGKDEAIKATQGCDSSWESDDEGSWPNYNCAKCGLAMPDFAMTAHERFHDFPD